MNKRNLAYLLFALVCVGFLLTISFTHKERVEIAQSRSVSQQIDSSNNSVLPENNNGTSLTSVSNPSPSLGLQDDFSVWLSTFDPQENDQAILDEGVRLAKSRREILEKEIIDSPQTALRRALSYSEYASLPPVIQQIIEQPISVAADLDILPNESKTISLRGHGNTAAIQYQENGKRFYHNIKLFGDRKNILSKQKLSVQGIRLGKFAAIRESAFQLLTPNDQTWAKNTLVTGNKDITKDYYTDEPINNTPVVALSEGKAYYFSSLDNVFKLNDAINQLENKAGPKSHLLARSTLAAMNSNLVDATTPLSEVLAAVNLEASIWTETNKKVYFIRIDFSDLPGESVSQAALASALNNSVVNTITDFSYGKTTLEGKLANSSIEVSSQVVRVPKASTYYKNLDTGNSTAGSGELHADATTAFNALNTGINLDDFDIVGIHFTGIGLSYAGLASVGGSKHWLHNSTSTRVIVHEFGHNYGLNHANYWDTNGLSVVGSGTEINYGDSYDVMGSGESDFHIQAKTKLNWIPTAEWTDVTTSGSHRLYRFDQGTANANTKALRLTKGNDEYYWLGYRKDFTSNNVLQKGAYIIWQRPSASNSVLIDTTPGSSGGKDDAGISMGRTYSDTTAGIHITPTANGGNGDNAWIDIEVNVGAFAGNRNPVVSLNTPAVLNARTPITFVANASDPDGDALAYSWDFGDGVIQDNTNSIEQNWTVGGNYTIKVTVSDMKGGTATATLNVTVTDPATTWYDRSPNGESNAFVDIASNRTMALAITNFAVYGSSDGMTWTQLDERRDGSTGLGFNTYLRSIIHDGIQWVAVGRDYDFDSNGWKGGIYTSPNGSDWTRRYFDGPTLRGVASSGSVLVAVGDDGAALRSTDTGVTWTPVSSGVSKKLINIAYGNSKFIAVGNEFITGDIAQVITSSDGLSWTDITSQSGTPAAYGYNSLEYLNDKFIGAGYNSKLGYLENNSSAFVTTRSDREVTQALMYGGGVYFAAGINQSNSSSDIDLISIDGKTWVVSPSTSAVENRNSGVFFKNTFITVGKNGSIRQSDVVASTVSATINVMLSSQTNVTVNGASTGAAAITASGGTSPYTYLWSNGATTASISDLVAGTYSVTVTDANGGTGTSSVTITEPSAVSVTLSSQTNVTVNGASTGAATVTASGGNGPYTYLWSNGATTASISDLAAGTYTVTVTDTNGGTGTASVTITEPSAVSVTVSSQTNVTVNGASTGAAAITASGGTSPYTYLWSNGATTASISDLAAGTYTVTVTDANGGTGTASVTITEPSAVSVTVSSQTNVVINGESTGAAAITASGGTSPYTYLWSNGATTASISGLAADTYTVMVTDANGGTGTASVTITEPSAVSVTVSSQTNVAINGESTGAAAITASGGTSPYTYLWSNGATSASISDLAAGTYAVTVTDANGGTTKTSVTITTYPSVLVTGAPEKSNEAFTVTFSFSTSVTGFEMSDITVTNATVSDFTGSGTTYTALITPSANNAVTIDVAEGVAQDRSGNPNTAAIQVLSKGIQTVSFAANTPTTKTTIDDDFTVTVTGGNSDELVRIASEDMGVCTIDDQAKVTIHTVGACQLVANQDGDSNYSAAEEARHTIAIVKAGQQISFTTDVPTTKTLGGANFTIAATGGDSGMDIMFESRTDSVCTITSAGEVSILRAGTCTLEISQAGNDDYSNALEIRTITIAEEDPVVTVASEIFSIISKSSLSVYAPNELGVSAMQGDRMITPVAYFASGACEDAVPADYITACTPVPDSGLTSGTHRLWWAVTADNGQRASALQLVNILPTIGFAGDTTIAGSAGNTVEVKVVLSGPMPTSLTTINVPYIVSGTATNPAEHNLVNGQFVIQPGNTSSDPVTITLGSSPVADHTIVITLDTDAAVFANAEDTIDSTVQFVAAGNVVRQTLKLRSSIPPRLSGLLGVQGSGSTVAQGLVFNRENGDVTLNVEVTDGSEEARYSYNWAGSDASLSDLMGQVVANPMIDITGMQPGRYYIEVEVQDTTDMTQPSAVLGTMLTILTDEGRSPNLDSDGDGLTDAEEGTSDPDGDGLPNYLDAYNTLANVMPTTRENQQGFLMTTGAGVRLLLGKTALAANNGDTKISLGNLAEHGNNGQAAPNTTPETANLVHVFDYEIENMPIPDNRQSGFSVGVVVPLDKVLTRGSEFLVYTVANGWKSFNRSQLSAKLSSSGSHIAWADWDKGVVGNCPASDSDLYNSNIDQKAGKSCLLVTVQDGGENDADGVVNGRLINTLGVSSPATSVTATTLNNGGSGGGSLSWLALLLGFVLLGLKNIKHICQPVGFFTFALFFVSTSQAATQRGLLLSLGLADQSTGVIKTTLAESGYTDISVLGDTQEGAASVGYRHPLGLRWSVDLQYLQQGKSQPDVQMTLLPGKTDLQAAQDVAESMPRRGQGISAVALYHRPLTTRLDIQMGIGAFVWKSEREAIIGTASYVSEENGVSPVVQLGLSYPLMKGVQVEGHLQHTLMPDKPVNRASIGVAIGF